VLDQFSDDGVVYLELRTTPRICADLSKAEYVATVIECIEEFGKTKMSTYLILSIDRENTANEAMEVVDIAIKYKPRGVVGVDLCGNPLKGNVKTFQDAFSKAKDCGLKITLHFAEIPASSSAEELRTLLSFDPERLGHVINVPEIFKEEIIHRKLGLELCLTCNVNAQLISGGFSDHHFGFWRNTVCPIIICVSNQNLLLVLILTTGSKTDDVGIFCSLLSNEYLLLAKHFLLTREALLDICNGAIKAVFGGEDEKVRLHALLKSFQDIVA
jgi:adenosine deaminase